MKKWMLWVGVAVALCIAALAVLTVLYLNRNPNVGVSLADQEDGTVLLESLKQAELKVHTGTVGALPDDCAAYVVETVDLSLADAIVQAAGQTSVIFVNRKPAVENACYIGGDAFQAGQAQGALLLAQPGKGDWNEDGVVTCLLLGPQQNQPDMQQWRDGIQEALSDKGLAAEFITYEGAAFSQTDAKALCTQVLSSYGKDLEAVLACFDSVALGAMEAVRSSGRSVGRNLTFVGAGHSSALAEMVAEGKMSGYAYMDEAQICQAVIAAVEAARIGKLPEGLILEYTPVLPE